MQYEYSHDPRAGSDRPPEPGKPWPLPPQETFTIVTEDDRHMVSLELRRHEGGEPVVVGIHVRRVVPTADSPSPLDYAERVELPVLERGRPPREVLVRWPEGTDKALEPLSIREINRMPLASYLRAALLIATTGFNAEKIERLILPKGRPERGRSTQWYQELAAAYRTLVREGEPHPVRVLARRKRVSENTVHQWIYRARQLGFLEPAPKTRGRK